MNEKREQAKVILRGYFRQIAYIVGGGWSSDNDAEIDELVDCLIDAAKEEIKQEATRLVTLEPDDHECDGACVVRNGGHEGLVRSVEVYDESAEKYGPWRFHYCEAAIAEDRSNGLRVVVTE